MNIIVLNGSPRPHGQTSEMISIFKKSAEENGHSVNVVDVFRKDINDCVACEYCHTKGNGECIQQDDMAEVTDLMKESEMLVLASPIYYKGVTGRLKCAIDRFYAPLYPTNKTPITKIAMFLASGAPEQYDGAVFSYEGDFLGYLGLEAMGVYTSFDENVHEKIKQLGEKI